MLIDPGNITPNPTPRPLSAIEQLTPSSNGNYYHTVKSGKSLAWIADLHDINLVKLMAWNGLTSDSVIQSGQQVLLRVTPPVSTTPIPAQPSITTIITQTPLTPTSTQELTTPLAIASATTDAEAQSGLPGIGRLIVVVLVFAGLLLLEWASRGR